MAGFRLFDVILITGVAAKVTKKTYFNAEELKFLSCASIRVLFLIISDTLLQFWKVLPLEYYKDDNIHKYRRYNKYMENGKLKVEMELQKVNKKS